MDSPSKSTVSRRRRKGTTMTITMLTIVFYSAAALLSAPWSSCRCQSSSPLYLQQQQQQLQQQQPIVVAPGERLSPPQLIIAATGVKCQNGVPVVTSDNSMASTNNSMMITMIHPTKEAPIYESTRYIEKSLAAPVSSPGAAATPALSPITAATSTTTSAAGESAALVNQENWLWPAALASDNNDQYVTANGQQQQLLDGTNQIDFRRRISKRQQQHRNSIDTAYPMRVKPSTGEPLNEMGEPIEDEQPQQQPADDQQQDTSDKMVANLSTMQWSRHPSQHGSASIRSQNHVSPFVGANSQQQQQQNSDNSNTGNDRDDNDMSNDNRQTGNNDDNDDPSNQLVEPGDVTNNDQNEQNGQHQTEPDRSQTRMKRRHSDNNDDATDNTSTTENLVDNNPETTGIDTDNLPQTRNSRKLKSSDGANGGDADDHQGQNSQSMMMRDSNEQINFKTRRNSPPPVYRSAPKPVSELMIKKEPRFKLDSEQPPSAAAAPVQKQHQQQSSSSHHKRPNGQEAKVAESSSSGNNDHDTDRQTQQSTGRTKHSIVPRSKQHHPQSISRGPMEMAAGHHHKKKKKYSGGHKKKAKKPKKKKKKKKPKKKKAKKPKKKSKSYHHGHSHHGHGGGGHHVDHGKYYEYREVPKKGAWKFGYKRGNHKHTIERKEDGHKSHFKTLVKWMDKKAHGKGVHIFDYNHDKKHHHGHHHSASTPEKKVVKTVETKKTH